MTKFEGARPDVATRGASEGIPLTLDVTGRLVVVIGGGPAAARGAARYASAGARVVVVAQPACEDVTDLAADGLVEHRERDWTAEDLGEAWLVHAATGDPRGDAAVASTAGGLRVWCLTEPTENGPWGSGATASAEPRTRRPSYSGPGWVALVGGGPGDPDLLTRRGHDLVHQADVVVVDRLAPRAVLTGLDPDVEIVDVGKTPGNHPVPQDEINRILLEHATAGRRVVRLKGGDPFVFGRGGEEALFCAEADVEVFVVPGVTSALSVPAAAGIPVTHRSTSRSVTVLTGHDVHDPERLAAFASITRAGGTLVVLMGVERLAEFAAGLSSAGAAPETPVAIVERGWTPRQRTTRATLETAAETAKAREVRPPAVIVVGDVAGLDVLAPSPEAGTG
jgi:uroporphyrin-III C-methyltransferase/precorrin-2 dehydrogenase/sirohydrochlorin ferrochelatase